MKDIHQENAEYLVGQSPKGDVIEERMDGMRRCFEAVYGGSSDRPVGDWLTGHQPVQGKKLNP